MVEYSWAKIQKSNKRNSYKKLFNNSKNILYNFNGILKDSIWWIKSRSWSAWARFHEILTQQIPLTFPVKAFISTKPLDNLITLSRSIVGRIQRLVHTSCTETDTKSEQYTGQARLILIRLIQIFHLNRSYFFKASIVFIRDQRIERWALIVIQISTEFEAKRCRWMTLN